MDYLPNKKKTLPKRIINTYEEESQEENDNENIKVSKKNVYEVKNLINQIESFKMNALGNNHFKNLILNNEKKLQERSKMIEKESEYYSQQNDNFNMKNIMNNIDKIKEMNSTKLVINCSGNENNNLESSKNNIGKSSIIISDFILKNTKYKTALHYNREYLDILKDNKTNNTSIIDKHIDDEKIKNINFFSSKNVVLKNDKGENYIFYDIGYKYLKILIDILRLLNLNNDRESNIRIDGKLLYITELNNIDRFLLNHILKEFFLTDILTEVDLISIDDYSKVRKKHTLYSYLSK